MKNQYDAVVIGSGQGGGPLALELSKQSKQTLLVERDLIGGTCINRGCTPTKTMVASAKAAWICRQAKNYGVAASFQGVEMDVVRKRKQKIVDSFRSSNQKKLESTKGLDVVFGKAQFVDASQLEIDGTRVSFSLAFINTGCRPNVPSIEGLNDVSYLDSTSIMELDELPDHLIAIGAGYISLEFGQMFRRFGSRVTLIEPSERLVKREDPDISDALKNILLEEGIEIFFNSKVKKVSSDGDKQISVSLEDKEVVGSHLLVGAGRVPNTEELNLEKANISKDDKGFIVVNEELQTSVSHIYAIGDVKGGPAFTHISYDDYRVIRDNLFQNKRRSVKDRLVPYTVFTDPQLGSIGLKEAQAKKMGIPHKVFKMPMNYVARAIEIGNDRGLMKVIVHAETDEILGCTILGVEGGELMSMLAIAMMGKIPYHKLKDAVFAHPTLAESLNNLFSQN